MIDSQPDPPDIALSRYVLLVDDDPSVLRALQAVFQAEGFETAVAQGGREALDAVEARDPDLIVLDVGLPDVLGTEVARRLRARGLTTPILMLTALDAEEDVVAGLDSGATAYVTKPLRGSEIRAWSRALLRSAGETEPVRRFGELELDMERHRATLRSSGRAVRLTPRQVRLLAVLMEGGATPLSREHLLQRVWDMDFDPGTTVVDVQLSHLRRKLAALGGEVVIQTLRNQGYRLAPRELSES